MGVIYIMSLIIGVFIFIGMVERHKDDKYEFKGVDMFIILLSTFLFAFGANGLFL